MQFSEINSAVNGLFTSDRRLMRRSVIYGLRQIGNYVKFEDWRVWSLKVKSNSKIIYALGLCDFIFVIIIPVRKDRLRDRPFSTLIYAQNLKWLPYLGSNFVISDRFVSNPYVVHSLSTQHGSECLCYGLVTPNSSDVDSMVQMKQVLQGLLRLSFSNPAVRHFPPYSAPKCPKCGKIQFYILQPRRLFDT